MKANNDEQQTIALLEIPVGKQHEANQKLHFNHVINNNMKPNTLIKIEENPFLAIEQPDLVLIPMLWKLGPRTPNIYMTVLWNPEVKL